MKKLLIISSLIVGCLTLIGGCGVVSAGLYTKNTYNQLVEKSQKVDASWGQVQNVYQRRYDLIPNLVASVQGAASFEKSTFVEVAEARASVGAVRIDKNNAPTTAAELESFQKAQTGLSSALSRLMIISEKYPELKANRNFLNLQSQIEGTENRISVERRTFNEITQSYNILVNTFPSNVVAKYTNFKEKPYFAADSNSQKAPVVQFNFTK